MTHVIDFLKSLVVPSMAKRYRYMSGIISVFILVVSIYLIYVPVATTLTNNIEDYAKDNDFASVLYNVEDSLNVGTTDIKNSNYKIELVDSSYVLTTTNESEQIKKYVYTYNVEDKIYKVYYVFDVNMYVDDQIESIYKTYMEKYTDESTQKASYASMIIYSEIANKGLNLDDRIDYYHNASETDIDEIISNMNYTDLYGIEADDYTYCILFLEASVYAEISKVMASNENELRIQISYENIDLNMDEVENINDFSKPFALSIASSFIQRDKLTYLGSCLMYAFVFPIVVAFLMWICLRRRGCLRTFKEFFNITVIASIIPTIICFIASWFISNVAGVMYVFLLTVSTIYLTYNVINIKDM